MAIRTVVTRGYGNSSFSGTIALVTTRGYAMGAVPATQFIEYTAPLRIFDYTAPPRIFDHSATERMLDYTAPPGR